MYELANILLFLAHSTDDCCSLNSQGLNFYTIMQKSWRSNKAFVFMIYIYPGFLWWGIYMARGGWKREKLFI